MPDLLLPFLVCMLLLVLAGMVYGMVWLGWMIPSLVFWGAPYVATEPETVRKMVAMAGISADDVACDLGSGDGRLVIAAAQAGAKRAVGYEIQPRLIWIARRAAKAEGVEARATFIRQSMWKADLRSTNVVFLYQISYAMRALSEKLRTEMPKGACVISSGFVFSDWEPVETVENVRKYIVR